MLVGDTSTFATSRGTAAKPKGLGAALTARSMHGTGPAPAPAPSGSAVPASVQPFLSGGTPYPAPARPTPRPGSTAPSTTTMGPGGVPVTTAGGAPTWGTGPSQGFQQMYGMWGGMAPETGANPYLAQIPMMSGWYDWQGQYANQSNNLAQQSLGVQMQGNHVDQGANTADTGILNQLQGLAGQDYQNTLAGFGIDRTEAGQRRDRDKFDEENRAAAGGVGTFPAHGRNLGDIASAYKNTTGRIGLGETGAGITHQQTLLGLDRQKLQNSTTAQKLDLMAQQYGISAQELQLGLQNTMTQLGYQEGQALAGLLEQAGSHDQAQAQAALQALQSLYAMSSMYGGFAGGS